MHVIVFGIEQFNVKNIYTLLHIAHMPYFLSTEESSCIINLVIFFRYVYNIFNKRTNRVCFYVVIFTFYDVPNINVKININFACVIPGTR